MERITLNGIKKDNNTIQYDFSVSSGLSKYFSGKPFVIEYQEDVTAVPDSIAAVPFVCNVLPIIWLTDSELVLDELDKAFFECIPEVRKGYETMFPESQLLGTFSIKRVVKNSSGSTNKCALLFSGGLDSISTLVSHFEEVPDLISLWGSDIRFDNADGWNVVFEGISETVQRFGLPEMVVHSAFREFDKEHILDDDFSQQLKNGWWHGVKHALAIISHVAPLAFLKGYTKLYIASSNCPADGLVRIASSPLTDSYIRFVNCAVIHDGYENSRQDKLRNVVEYCKTRGVNVPLHVCWESQKGNNCCYCEKCYRTMVGLIAEGVDPRDYGFEYSYQAISVIRNELIGMKKLAPDVAQRHWQHIYNRACANKKVIKKTPYWKYIKWIIHSDFMNLKTIKPTVRFRLRQKLGECSFYQGLHRLKVSLLNKIG